MKRSILTCIICLFCSPMAFGQKKLEVFVAEFSPLAWKAKKSPVARGFFPKVIGKILANIGHEPKFTFVPVARYNQLLLQGEVPISFSPEVELPKTHTNFGKVYELHIGTVTLKSKKTTTQVGCSINNSPFLKGEKMVAHNSFAGCMELLKRGRVDAVVGIQSVMLSAAADIGVDVKYTPMSSLQLSLIVNKKIFGKKRKAVIETIKSFRQEASEVGLDLIL